jgi:hypothetical protein
MKYAVDTAMKNLGSPWYLQTLVAMFNGIIGNIHFSGLAVAVKNPITLSSTARQNLNNFINTFPDQQPGYTPFINAQIVSSWFGYNYKSTYSMSDLGFIEQSEAVCKWSTRP